jgi:hypothetical protein
MSDATEDDLARHKIQSFFFLVCVRDWAWVCDDVWDERVKELGGPAAEGAAHRIYYISLICKTIIYIYIAF